MDFRRLVMSPTLGAAVQPALVHVQYHHCHHIPGARQEYTCTLSTGTGAPPPPDSTVARLAPSPDSPRRQTRPVAKARGGGRRSQAGRAGAPWRDSCRCPETQNARSWPGTLHASTPRDTVQASAQQRAVCRHPGGGDLPEAMRRVARAPASRTPCPILQR